MPELNEAAVYVEDETDLSPMSISSNDSSKDDDEPTLPTKSDVLITKKRRSVNKIDKVEFDESIVENV
uniref:Gag-pol polyprotein n=1 Tax=Strongyloides papillosus TaxID=174720 RepID=A0A0N5B486_STREA